MHPRWVALIWTLGNGFSGTPVGSDASYRAGVCGVTRSEEPANRRSSRWPWDVRPERAAVVTRVAFRVQEQGRGGFEPLTSTPWVPRSGRSTSGRLPGRRPSGP
jgi:hypothetical protein